MGNQKKFQIRRSAARGRVRWVSPAAFRQIWVQSQSSDDEWLGSAPGHHPARWSRSRGQGGVNLPPTGDSLTAWPTVWWSCGTKVHQYRGAPFKTPPEFICQRLHSLYNDKRPLNTSRILNQVRHFVGHNKRPLPTDGQGETSFRLQRSTTISVTSQARDLTDRSTSEAFIDSASTSSRQTSRSAFSPFVVTTGRTRWGSASSPRRRQWDQRWRAGKPGCWKRSVQFGLRILYFIELLREVRPAVHIQGEGRGDARACMHSALWLKSHPERGGGEEGPFDLHCSCRGMSMHCRLNRRSTTVVCIECWTRTFRRRRKKLPCRCMCTVQVVVFACNLIYDGLRYTGPRS